MRRLLGPSATAWRRFIALTAPREAALRSRLSTEMLRVAAAASSAVAEGLDPSNVTAHARTLNRILVASYTEGMPKYAAPLREALGKARKPVGFEARVKKWIETNAARKVTQVSSTTQDQIRRIVAKARSEGLDTSAVAQRLRKQMGTIGRARASAIARTEVHGAANAAQLMMAEDAGIEMQREWIAAVDERTRDDHAAADGQIVGLREPFTVGGESLMFPGDPDGSPEQIVNCRCAQGFVV